MPRNSNRHDMKCAKALRPHKHRLVDKRSALLHLVGFRESLQIGSLMALTAVFTPHAHVFEAYSIIGGIYADEE